MNGSEVTSNTEAVSPYHRWWDWFTAILLVILLEVAGGRLAATEWTEDLGIVLNIIFWGAVAGLAIGKSAFRRLTSLLISLCFGIFVLMWQLGALVTEAVEWDERLVRLGSRLYQVVMDIVLRNPVTDNILFLSAMALVFWILSLYAAYQVVRYGHIWRVVLPAGLAAFIIQGFDNAVDRRTWSLGFYLFLALAIVARLSFLHMKRRWELTRTYIPPDVDIEIGRMAVIISLVVVLAMWNFPALTSAVRGFSDVKAAVERPWERFKDRMSFMFDSLRTTAGISPLYYDEQRSLGRGIPISEAVVMRVEVPNYPQTGGRYYWRGRSYDIYEDGLWFSSESESIEFDPEFANQELPTIEGRIWITAKFKPNLTLGTLYTPAQPQWVNRKGDFLVMAASEGLQDLIAINADPVVLSGEVYEVQASVISASKKQLREAGEDYPSWVIERYLQLPETITPRVRQLAEALTQPYDNPYDKAEAITQYLRENIEYVDEIEIPPANQEIIDWFLFDYRKGFCNYYATAEVILLRAAGIPARWVVGYAQGDAVPLEAQPTFLPPDTVPSNIIGLTQYAVRQSDAHAWPEVYFPGIGWAEFEPTVSLLPITYPEDIRNSESELSAEDRLNMERNLPQELEERLPPDSSASLEAELLERQKQRQLIGLLVINLFLIGLMLMRWMRNPRSHLRRWLQKAVQGERLPLPVRLERFFRWLGFTPPAFLRQWAAYALMPVLGRAYQEINMALMRLGKPVVPSDTPFERAKALKAALPEAAPQIEKLLYEYHTYIYNNKPANSWTAQQMAAEIRRVSRRVKMHQVINGWRQTLAQKFEV